MILALSRMVPKGASLDGASSFDTGLPVRSSTLPKAMSQSRNLYSWEVLLTAVVLAAFGGAALGFLGGTPIAERIAEYRPSAGLWQSGREGGTVSKSNSVKLNQEKLGVNQVGEGLSDTNCLVEKRAGQDGTAFPDNEGTSSAGSEGGKPVESGGTSADSLWNPPVKVFYHVAAVGKSFEQMIIDHMTRLMLSGVYERAEGIYCFVMGNTRENITAAEETLVGFGSKVRVVNMTLDVSLFERFTLESIRNHVDPTDVILYLHTKGVTKPGDMNVFYWTLYMHYFLLRRHERCIQLLQTYDTVGCQILRAPKTHYSGNFWWARASYFLKLEPRIGPDYYEPEMYLGSGPDVSMHQVWEAENRFFYTYSYVPSMYVDKDIAYQLGS